MLPADSTEEPLRLAVDARPLSGNVCGFTTYIASIVDPLRRAGFDVTLLSNRPIRPEFEDFRHDRTEVFGPKDNLLWENVGLTQFLARNHFDLYFNGSNRGIPLLKVRRTRYIVGLQDIIPFLFFRNYFLYAGLRGLPRTFLRGHILSELIAVARADSILAVSESSARDIRRVFRRRNVTANWIRLKAAPEPVPRPAGKQFVYIGGVDQRKKIDVMIRGFARFHTDHPDHKLILIGRAETYRHSYASLIDSLGLNDGVELAGYVDHETKLRLFGESLAMVYPSLYEGYGLALAEGMQAGIPVIAGRGGSQAEVGGDAVRWVDPTDPGAIAGAMEEMLDPAVRSGWIERGRERLKVLTDERIEAELVAYFRHQGQLARRRGGRRSRGPTEVAGAPR